MELTSNLTRFVVFLLAIHIRVQSTEGCSCFYKSDAEKYCTEDFAIQVRVLNESAPFYAVDDKGQIVPYLQAYEYTVEIQEVLRSESKYPTARKVIQTLVSSGLCGRRLFAGHTYVIASSVEPDIRDKDSSQVMFVHSCSLVIDMAFVPSPDLIENPPDCSNLMSPYELYLLNLLRRSMDKRL